MREIEVKAKLADKDCFLTAAKKLGIDFGDPLTQEDVTYEINLPRDHPDWNIFRIRKQGGRIILTMKHKASARPRDNYEYETTIDNEAEAIKMLERLGYKRGVEINKKRRIATYKDLEFCLDEVERLGQFVEIEKMAKDDADGDAIQSELWSLLDQLGIGPDARVYKGYESLMHDNSQAETNYLNSSAANRKHLEKSIASLRAGKVEKHDLVDN